MNIMDSDTLEEIAEKINNQGSGIAALVKADAGDGYRLVLKTGAVESKSALLAINDIVSSKLEIISIRGEIENIIPEYAREKMLLSSQEYNYTGMENRKVPVDAPPVYERLYVIADDMVRSPVTAIEDYTTKKALIIKDIKGSIVKIIKDTASFSSSDDIANTTSRSTGMPAENIESGSIKVMVFGMNDIVKSQELERNIVIEKVAKMIENINDIAKYVDNWSEGSPPAGTVKATTLQLDTAMVKNVLFSSVKGAAEGEATDMQPRAIGIKIDGDNLLHLDSKVLESALSSRKEETISTLKGMGSYLHERLNLYIDPNSGALVYQKKPSADNIGGADKSHDDFTDQLEKEREDLEKRAKMINYLIDGSNRLIDALKDRMDLAVME